MSKGTTVAENLSKLSGTSRVNDYFVFNLWDILTLCLPVSSAGNHSKQFRSVGLDQGPNCLKF